MADLGEMTRCQNRWDDANQRLQALAVAGGLSRHKAQLDSARSFAGDVMGTFLDLRPGADNTMLLDRMSIQIKRAYAHLDAASSPKAKLQMVDFSHACCSCGHERQQ